MFNDIGISTMAGDADQMADSQTLRIKHTFSRSSAFALSVCNLFDSSDNHAQTPEPRPSSVYSTCLDSPMRVGGGDDPNEDKEG